jgi:hypothetical protein
MEAGFNIAPPRFFIGQQALFPGLGRNTLRGCGRAGQPASKVLTGLLRRGRLAVGLKLHPNKESGFSGAGMPKFFKKITMSG